LVVVYGVVGCHSGEGEATVVTKGSAWRNDETIEVWRQIGDLLVRGQAQTSAIFDRLEGDVAVIKTDVAGLKTDVAGLKTDVAGLKTDVAVLKTDVAVLKTDVAVLKTDVAVLKTDVAVIKTDVTELKTDVTELKTDVAELKTDVASLGEQLNRLELASERREARVDAQFEQLRTFISRSLRKGS
jgi:chromosome segregation ATPase